MTAAGYVLAVLAAIVCGAAARRIAVAKGRSDAANFAWAGFLAGPVGPAWAAFVSPVGEDTGKDRLAWWGESSPARAWTGLAALAVAVTVGFGVYLLAQPATFDGNDLEPQIAQWLGNNGAPGANVDCPDSYKGESGYTFLCSATDSTGTAHVEVTVLNDKGQVNWTVIG